MSQVKAKTKAKADAGILPYGGKCAAFGRDDKFSGRVR
jgi:hypothetical protein